jgi:hypothetical protein
MAWSSVGIGGGGAFSQAAAGPTGIVWITGDVAGLYKSSNGGASWTILGDAQGLNDQNLYSVACDPNDPLIMYVGGEGGDAHHGLLKTADGGSTFTAYTNITGTVTAIAVAASDYNRVYAANHSSFNSTDPTIYESTNRGSSFASIGILPAGTRCLKLVVDVSTSSIVYAVTGDQGPLVVDVPERLYRSANSGGTWVLKGPTDSSGSPYPVVDVAIDPNDSATWYVTTAPTTKIGGCSTTSGSNVLTTTKSFTAKAIHAGMPISGTGIPSGTTVLTVGSATSLTLTQNATASSSGATATLSYNQSGTWKSITSGGSWALMTTHTGCITAAAQDAYLVKSLAASEPDLSDPYDGTFIEYQTGTLSGTGVDNQSDVIGSSALQSWTFTGPIAYVQVSALVRVDNPLAGSDAATIASPKITWADSVTTHSYDVAEGFSQDSFNWVQSSPQTTDPQGAPWTAGSITGLTKVGVSCRFVNVDQTPWGPYVGRIMVSAVRVDVYAWKTQLALQNPDAVSSAEQGTFKSLDGGTVWTHYLRSTWQPGWKPLSGFGVYGKQLYGACQTIGRDLSNARRLFWCTSQFAYVSDDLGETFHPLFTNGQTTTGLECSIPTCLSLTWPTIYAGYYDIGIIRSDDGGFTWASICDRDATRISLGTQFGWVDGYGGNCLSILVDPANALRVWACVSNESADPQTVIRSTDGGNTWTAGTFQGLPLKGFAMGLSLDTSSSPSNRKLWVTVNGAAYKSIDDGVTWTVLRSNANGNLRVTAGAGLIVMAAGEGGLWRTADGGTNWAQPDSTKFSPGTAASITMRWKGVQCLLLSGTNAYACYYNDGTSGKGLYASTDSGVTWSALGSGESLADDYSRCVVRDDNGVLYHASSKSAKAGANSGQTSTGVKKKSGSWSSLMSGTAWPEFAWPLAVKPDGTTLIAGFPGQGLFTTAP